MKISLTVFEDEDLEDLPSDEEEEKKEEEKKKQEEEAKEAAQSEQWGLFGMVKKIF